MVMAYIYTLVGEYDAAIDEFELLLSIPCKASTGWLKADPILAPLYELPRFKALIERYESSPQYISEK